MTDLVRRKTGFVCAALIVLVAAALPAHAGAAKSSEPPHLKTVPEGFTTVDLRPCANMGWQDEVANDGKGGWTDQGANDMRNAPLGLRDFRGIPFQLIDPKTNGGKSVLVFKSTHFENGLETVTIPLNGARAERIYVLQSAAWLKDVAARFTLIHEDGTRGKPLQARKDVHVCDWWSPKDGPSCKVAFYAGNPERTLVGMTIMEWVNEAPEKALRSLVIENGDGEAITLVGGLTLSAKNGSAFREGDAPTPPKASQERQSAYTETIPAVEAARAIACSMDGKDTSERIARLGGALAIQPKLAVEVLDALAKDATFEDALLRAELLVWIARGEPEYKPVYGEKGYPRVETPRVAAEALKLIEHEDPFVRGLAEWAIAIRVGMDYEAGKSPWPEPGKEPDWYSQWLTIDPAHFLDFDYVRQAAVLGQHCSLATLQASGDEIVRRARSLATSYTGASSTETCRAKAESLLVKVDEVHGRLKSADGIAAARKAWLDLRRAAREVVFANPAVDFNQLVFATRAGNDSGNITNGHLRDIYPPGGDIWVKTGFNPGDPARPLLKGKLQNGHVRGLDLWWDGDRVLFSFIRQPGFTLGRSAGAENSELGLSDTAHLYEIDLDGAGFRQITDAKVNMDVEPCYLPNGDIVFCSDRSNYGSQCAGAFTQDKMIVNLYRCAPDGSRIRPLSNNKDFDRHPHVMENGNLLFVHWEYQERHLWQTHTLWTSRPDGSGTDAFYKQHISTGPMSLRGGRQIPGQNRVVAIACGHHNGELGAVMLVDHTLGVNDNEGMRLVTPHCSPTEGGYGRTKPVPEGGVQDRGGYYQYPFPLSDRSFLAAYSYRKPERLDTRNFGLYYIDVFGNKELIHRDRQLSVAYLMPVRKTTRPPVHPERDTDATFATVFVSDVHTGMPEVKPGTVKYLRVSQKTPWPCVSAPDKRCGFNDLHYVPAGSWTSVLGVWDWGPTRVIGIVPVEEDGSAHFKVPVRQPVYFQALDENYLEVRRMRSNVTFQGGEQRGCIGCHETKSAAPPAPVTAKLLALKREPSMPVPPSWGDRENPSFERHIQPIIEKHCARCHGEKDPAGGVEFTAHPVDGYLQSYRTMFGLKRTDLTPSAPDFTSKWYPKDAKLGDPKALKLMESNKQPGQLIALANRFGGPEVTAPHAFGSGKSPLIAALFDKDHKDEVKLPKDEWIALTTWVDLNAPYWDTYADKDHKTAAGFPRRVRVLFPDPWERPPSGEWIWQDETTVVLKP